MTSEDLEILRQLQLEANNVHQKMLSEGTTSAPDDDPSVWVAAGESGYVNCLITVIGEGPVNSVTIDGSKILPNLNLLAEGNPSLVNWTKQLNFNYSDLSSKEVLAILYNSFDLQNNLSGKLKTVLVNSDGSPVALLFIATRLERADLVTLRVIRAADCLN